LAHRVDSLLAHRTTRYNDALAALRDRWRLINEIVEVVSAVSAYLAEVGEEKTIMRKLLREAVIFMLLGPVVVGMAALIYLNRQSTVEIKAEAAKSVYATELPSPPPPGNKSLG
jgi:hypothetical protein